MKLNAIPLNAELVSFVDKVYEHHTSLQTQRLAA